MDIHKVLAQVDAFFEENRGEEAEELMQQSIGQAVQEQDDASLLHLLNELLGYYRETSQKENAMKIASQAIAQADRMGLEGTIPYATTLLNVANACRVCGKLPESMDYYRQVEEIYGRQLEPDDMFVAGLKNNMSLLYQEMGDFGRAKEMLTGALAIVEKKGSLYEKGVTYANLAGTCMQLGEVQAAYEYAVKSTEVFQRANVADSHYGAALAALGAYYYREKSFETALQYYRQAAEAVEKSLGRNDYYCRLQAYVESCEKALAAVGQEKGGSVSERENGKAGSVNGRESEGREAQKDVADEAECGEGQKGAMDATDFGGEEMRKDGMNAASIGVGEEQKKQYGNDAGAGLTLARAYYEAYGRQMIQESFPAYEDRIAVGLAGRGSDCFGYDDEASRDHDWGPDFCMWVTDDTYGEIGEALQQAYESLPKEFHGYKRAPRVNGRNRRGVIRISDFFRELTGADCYEQIDWRQVSDASLAAAVNGEIFRDEEGVLTLFRQKLCQGYPEEIRYLKLAECMAGFAQTAQYNYPRMLGRGDELTAHMMVWDGIRGAMKLQHYIEGKYPPHDKWLYRSLEESEEGREAALMLKRIAEALQESSGDGQSAGTVAEAVTGRIEQLGAFFAMELYQEGCISDTDSYLDAHTEELIYKASLAGKDKDALVDEIAGLEFEAFDKVQNEGGRASCQNDWPTFSIMRKSQYLTWDRGMLMQYLYDFQREYHKGHNLIEEKYGRMMESTAPEEYEKIKSHFPALSPEKKAIIEQIVGLQVGWMEEFAGNFPALADNARSIHTWEDHAFDTSYETYLRGELGTYSDKMLELYGRYVVEYARSGTNLTYAIMENSVKMYGYTSIEEANRKIAGIWS